MSPGEYIHNVLVGIDQFANTLTGGQSDETLSSRLGRDDPDGLLSQGLGLIEADHVLRSIEFTPWGTVDPHSLPPVNECIAADWNAAIAVIFSPRDLDAFPEATKAAAQRALLRLHAWATIRRHDVWGARMERDLDAADRLKIE